MVMFNFKPQFVQRIYRGSKTQTIRGARKRNAIEGDGLQIYTGPRMKPVKLGDAICFMAGDVEINLTMGQVRITWDATEHRPMRLESTMFTKTALDSFAFSDGFDDWEAMRAFFLDQHKKGISPKMFSRTNADTVFLDGRIAKWRNFKAYVAPPKTEHVDLP